VCGTEQSANFLYGIVHLLTLFFFAFIKFILAENATTDMLSRAESRVTQDFAAAEKDICDDVGIALAAVIRAAETNHHVLINEVRVTMLDDGDGKRWVQAVCTITR